MNISPLPGEGRDRMQSCNSLYRMGYSAAAVGKAYSAAAVGKARHCTALEKPGANLN
jgi:hypothetical protein